MPEKFTEVTRVGFGERIKEALGKVILGFILFIASFVVLWINEGRMDMSKVAKKAISVDPSFIERTAEGKLISVTGELKSPETIGDPEFLKPGPYLKLERKVEMYAWVEHKKERSEKKLGGEEVRITDYTYTKEWTFHPPDSSSFRYPQGHENPPMAIQGKEFLVSEASVGAYKFLPSSVIFPPGVNVSLSPENVILNKNAQLVGDYIFIGQGSFTEPQIGDLRISFKAVMSGSTVTLFGKLEGNEVHPYYQNGNKLYRIFHGSRDEAIAQMAKEYKVSIWLFRLFGFLMMWLGLVLLFELLNTILDIVPIVGGISRLVISISTLVVALALSLATIVVSKITHNFILLILTLLIIIGGSLWWIKTKKKKPISPQV